MISCAIYCRYSSEQQRSSLSIEAQRRSCEEYVKKQGWQIYKIYVDEARSGTSDKRESFQQMISAAIAATPPFQVVLVYKSDRFARNREDAVKYKAILKRQKIRFVSATEPIGTGDVTEVLLESMLDGIAEFYSLQLSQRTLAGMAEAARNGWAIGMPPYGYKHAEIETPKGKKKRLVVDASRARIVRKIFSMYAKGDGVQTIQKKLHKDGLRFNKNFIFKMLRKERYIGNTSYGKEPAASSKTSMDPITIENTHEAIIDKPLWNKVQEILARRSPTSDNRFIQSDYLLSGILRCFCGSSMVGHAAFGRRARYRYYSCSAALRSAKAGCGNPAIGAGNLEEQLFGAIKEYLTDKDNIKGLIRANNRALEGLQKKKTGEISRLRQDATKKEAAAKNIMRAIEAGQGLHFSHVAARLDEIASEKSSIEARIMELEEFRMLQPISADEAAAFVNHIDGLFSSGLVKNKTLFQGLIQKIEIVKGGKRARVSYNPQFHPRAEIFPIKKASRDGRSSSGSHEAPLATQRGRHANLLGEQLVDLAFLPQRRWELRDAAGRWVKENRPGEEDLLTGEGGGRVRAA